MLKENKAIFSSICNLIMRSSMFASRHQFFKRDYHSTIIVLYLPLFAIINFINRQPNIKLHGHQVQYIFIIYEITLSWFMTTDNPFLLWISRLNRNWVWWSSILGDLGNVEYLFIAIAPRSTLTKSGSTW